MLKLSVHSWRWDESKSEKEGKQSLRDVFAIENKNWTIFVFLPVHVLGGDHSFSKYAKFSNIY